MERIALPKGEWLYDTSRPLGRPGGFGAVYEGVSDAYGPVAIKRLHLTANDAAHREMRIATDLAGRDLSYVVPVLDAGEDAGSGAYFVVMARAEKSLQGELDHGVRFSDLDATRVMLDVTNGLVEVSDIVHRDLKPANILFHAGRWKVADFGIARFLEESTSLQTLKGCLSPQYAAPEQWQYIRATSATDIYALGCVGYAILIGMPPFRATTEEDLREKHLHEDPPPLPSPISPRLRTLLSMMLRKAPNTRPTLERVRNILTELRTTPSNATQPAGFDLLAQAGTEVARDQARFETMAQQLRSEMQERSQLADTAKKIHGEILDRLFLRIGQQAPNAEKNRFTLVLGQGQLEASLAEFGGYFSKAALPPNAFPNSKWDVVAAEEIAVQQRQPEYRWSSSLWYCRLPNTTGYRWYETSYFSPHRAEVFAPYSLARNVKDADLAAAPIVHLYQVAFGPSAIDDEDEEDFIERWAALLALAAQGKLGHPSALPLQPKFWRGHFVA